MLVDFKVAILSRLSAENRVAQQPVPDDMCEWFLTSRLAESLAKQRQFRLVYPASYHHDWPGESGGSVLEQQTPLWDSPMSTKTRDDAGLGVESAATFEGSVLMAAVCGEIL